MKRTSWFLFGIGTLPLLGTVLFNSSVGVFEKSVVIAATLFVAAIIAAIEGTPARRAKREAARETSSEMTRESLFRE
ncbi:hypothetical protein ACX9R5_03555 [Rathayibacter sp. CAU 1779]